MLFIQYYTHTQKLYNIIVFFGPSPSLAPGGMHHMVSYEYASTQITQSVN